MLFSAKTVWAFYFVSHLQGIGKAAGRAEFVQGAFWPLFRLLGAHGKALPVSYLIQAPGWPTGVDCGSYQRQRCGLPQGLG